MVNYVHTVRYIPEFTIIEKVLVEGADGLAIMALPNRGRGARRGSLRDPVEAWGWGQTQAIKWSCPSRRGPLDLR